MITSLGADALHRAKMAALQADIIAALSIDVLKGTPRAFDPGGPATGKGGLFQSTSYMYMYMGVKVSYLSVARFALDIMQGFSS